METKYKGSIKLSAIGDALGWITEFEKSSQLLKEKYGTYRIETFYNWEKTVGGRFYGFVDHIRAGSYSDDTQLLLAVSRSIGRDGRVDHDYFAKNELVNWLDYARGGGRTVKAAAAKISRKSVGRFNNFYSYKVNGETFDYRQSGANGAAMRILPISLANIGNFEKIKKEIFYNSIITHGHPRAILGAMLYGYAVDQIIPLKPENFLWENYITKIGIDFPKKFAFNFSEDYGIKEWVKRWNELSNITFEDLYQKTIFETQNQLRLIYQSIKKGDSVKNTLNDLGCFDYNSKGSGVGTVVAGIYLASKFHDEPLTAIIESVNSLGSDTDSIAAFAGGLIGALHGDSVIPDSWKAVQDISYLDSTAKRLWEISEGKFCESTRPVETLSKAMNNLDKDDFKCGDTVNFNPLGNGKITKIDRQQTLVNGKYNLIAEVVFESGQSILYSKIFPGK